MYSPLAAEYAGGHATARSQPCHSLGTVKAGQFSRFPRRQAHARER